MTTGPSQEYVERQLRLADGALNAAKYLLEGRYYRDAASRAYYAMFHAAHAALAAVKAELPKSHPGVINLFGRHVVRAGLMDTRFARDLQRAYDLRLTSDYVAYGEIEEAQAADIIAKAQDFIEEVKRLIQRQSGA